MVAELDAASEMGGWKMRTIGERIREARRSAGMTQAELAERLGVSYQHIGQWERGLREPRWRSLQKLATALKVTFCVPPEGNSTGAEEILLQLDDDGVAKQAWKTEIYFDSEAERDEFDRKLTEGWCPLEWIDASKEIPVDERTVLCVVTGRYRGIDFHNAIVMGLWINGEWILETWPDIEKPNVTHWMELPERPRQKGAL